MHGENEGEKKRNGGKISQPEESGRGKRGGLKTFRYPPRSRQG